MARSYALAIACALSLAAAASPAAASRSQLSIFEDDRTMVLSDAAVRQRTLDDLRTLGVDVVHSIVFWNRIAPQPESTRRPAGFDGADPAAYPADLWDRYDALVRGATARGMSVLLSPSSPLPAWASGCRGRARARATCRPNLTQFKRFVTALGRRYSGVYADENDGGALLPRVAQWSVWNEPNQGGWLSPQYVVRAGRLVPVSPALYRSLARAAIAALQATGHGGDEILLGETAPLGRTSGPPSQRPMSPGDFLRALFCLDRAGRSLRGAAAAALDCAGRYRRLSVTGVSHHPYTRGGSRPPTDPGGRNEITISSAPRLKRILDQAGRRRRIRARIPIWYTEYGFQTSPPDTIFGVPLNLQASYLNQSDYIAWHDPRVRSVAQYEMRDETNPALFQSGLRFADGRVKPGFFAYRLPVWVVRSGTGIRVWGQVRPAADGAVETVEIQHDPAGGERFETVATVTTSSLKGFFSVRVTGKGRAGTWRLSWTPSTGGPAITSRTARTARR
jgi:hypothetical protein